MLCVDKQGGPTEIKINSGGLGIAIGERCKSDHGRGRTMLIGSIRRNCNPDVIAAMSRRRSRWIFRDIEIAVLIERQIVGQFEISGGIHANLYVIVNESTAVILSTCAFAQIDRQYSVLTGYRDVKRVSAARKRL